MNMSTGSILLHVDSEVAPLVLGIIEDAKQEVTIVTPYLKLWPHAKQALERAARKKVRLKLVIRKNRDDKDKDKDDVSWLAALGMEILEVENLHAKIYLNETSAILSSMNFHASSAQGSYEVAVPVNDPVTLSQLREYVTQTLIPLASSSSGKTSFIKSFDKMIREQVSRPYAAKSGGTCIRCRRHIKFEPDKPLCDEDYTSWAEWENPDYEEKFCHKCGDEAKVTYARPLCRRCFGATRH